MGAPTHPYPTLAQYCVRMEQLGCVVTQGVATSLDGLPESITKITAPSGLYVPVVGIQHREPLSAHVIANFDRRLMLDSGFLANEPPGT